MSHEHRPTPLFGPSIIRRVFIASSFAFALFVGAGPAWADRLSSANDRAAEDYVHVPMPPGFSVIVSELEGPVFTDPSGKTLYAWPLRNAGSGSAGDTQDQSECDDKVITKTAGLASPYPAGLDLPDVDKRRSCSAEWVPLSVDANAKPVGRWTIFTRSDGVRQWAYGHQPLYTYVLDREPGDVLGATTPSNPGFEIMFASPANRRPVGPPSAVPPGFKVLTTPRGRMIVTDKDFSVYSSDSDGPDKSRCFDVCAQRWQPLAAPESARPSGEWSIVERAPGLRQWAFRRKPLYRFAEESEGYLLDGSDVPGWRSVYAQLAPLPPKGFTQQVSANGDVLADANGRTLYIYRCVEDASDQRLCDTMDSTQTYRLAICGGGNAERCQKTWPYVVANSDAKSDSRIWSVVWVDPATGRRAQAGQAGALRVWAYRDRPVYTYVGDKAPGDFEGDATGEWMGYWNGFRAFWLRDQFNNRGG